VYHTVIDCLPGPYTSGRRTHAPRLRPSVSADACQDDRITTRHSNGHICDGTFDSSQASLEPNTAACFYDTTLSRDVLVPASD
jgi:hypothetical protein